MEHANSLIWINIKLIKIKNSKIYTIIIVIILLIQKKWNNLLRSLPFWITFVIFAITAIIFKIKIIFKKEKN